MLIAIMNLLITWKSILLFKSSNYIGGSLVVINH